MRPTRCHCDRLSRRLTAPAERSPATSTRATWFLNSSGSSMAARLAVSPRGKAERRLGERCPRAEKAWACPRVAGPPARSATASSRPLSPTGAATAIGSGAGAVVDDGRPAAAGELLQPLGEGAPRRRDRCRRSARRCRLRPGRREPPASAVAAARRVGANGCGCNAAAVERASAGASMRTACDFAGLAVASTTHGPVLRLGLGDEALDHARALRPARRGGPAVVDGDHDRPAPFSAPRGWG